MTSAFDEKPAEGVDTRGLFQKFLVTRVSDPEGRHEGCKYFVLDPQHDPFAAAALLRYAELAGKSRPALSQDLIEWLASLQGPVSE